ncbi:unnamed protein product [Microthlaspi erraticum]|uniref:Integrase catalytic domain-containing protein n=1 Tax=Microthlaspi erraticum TaxID=1685480 RepID=A0A6D2JET7_9BRAS|nr:unnamed protein product [Microthlaspi erraticum]CAA7053693.1 unnamed protein product [Microthlaspi erraticum]
MEEVYSGSCGNHSGGRALAIKIKRHRYYWSTMITDCEKYSANARSANDTRRRSINPLSCYHPSWRRTHSCAGRWTSWWVEADSYASIKDAQVEQFVWNNIICRHGVPYEIVTDNGSQFISARFEGFCEKWKIRLSKSTPRYPQGNGQAEATNKTIHDGLKKRLGEKKGCWADELEGVLWSHRTTPRRATRETPFALVYGTECIIPSEIHFPGVLRRILPEQEGLNHLMLLDELDVVNEPRDRALIRIQNYQQATARYYNANVRGRRFGVGDLVLRKVFQNTAELNAGKLGANWEGPYRITNIVRPGAYKIETLDGKTIQKPWNMMHLKKYYH